MKTAAKLGALLAVLFAAACSDAAPFEPGAGEDLSIDARRGHGLGTQEVRVLSRNLYIGFNVDETIAALATGDPEKIQEAIETALNTLIATDFPTRAGAVADEIARLKPDVVGLQEVYDININLGGGLPAINLPFKLILQGALADRGLNYVVAAENTLTDAQLPGIRLVDHDVMLVNPDRVQVLASDGQLFTWNLGDPGIGVDIVRGWTMVRAVIVGTEMEVWNAHLESGSDEAIVGLRALQADELAGLVSDELPAIVMGDLNDQPGSPMYGELTADGFEDGWAELRRRARGYTCCHADDLSNRRFRGDQRIDYVFARGLGHPRSGLKGVIRRTGIRPWERIAGPFDNMIWASDHAGLFAGLLMIPAHGIVD